MNLTRLAPAAIVLLCLHLGCGSAGDETTPQGEDASVQDTSADGVSDTGLDQATTPDGQPDAAPDAGPPDVVEAGPSCQPVPHCAATDPRCPAIGMFAEPDAFEAPFVDVISKADHSIRVMIYLMGYGGILDALKAKAGEGKSVRVILDQGQQSINQKYYDALVAAGAEVKWSDPKFSYMHAKTLVVDESAMVVSTGNYLQSNLKAERNYVMQDRDPDDVASMVALFDADWQQSEPDLSCTRLVVSPVNARSRIEALIDGAGSTLVVESMQLADDGVRNAIAARKAAGVDVRVILADPAWIDANTDAAAFLASNGIPARYLTSPKVHVKSIVADGARLYAGSVNLSWTSMTKNREVGLIDADPQAVKVVVDTFEADWAVATPF
jgi:cardiolipin synthase A/B